LKNIIIITVLRTFVVKTESNKNNKML